VDHAAFPTFLPAETVRFYRDVLGFPVAHTICAKGWGPAGHPDFVHFFFDVGRGARIAFFYYFGLPPTERGAGDAYARFEEGAPLFFVRSRHLALRVDTEAEMLEYKRRLDASEWPCEMVVTHETIESIYVHDPNGYFLEISRPTRELAEVEVADAEATIEALIRTVAGEAPTMEALWAHKGQIVGRETGRVTLYVLDVPDWSTLPSVAAADPEVEVAKVGPYFAISKAGPLVIDRAATGCRHAVWYSAVAGIQGGKITQYDKTALRVEPT
jgi:catechol 2,3-dioxygenase-like lactoylglutathione lyase family enzyme